MFGEWFWGYLHQGGMFWGMMMGMLSEKGDVWWDDVGDVFWEGGCSGGCFLG